MKRHQKIKARVNGQDMVLTIQKWYDNGIEMIWECTNDDGVWVAVADRQVIREKLNVRTRFEYAGDRSGDCRTVLITMTGSDEASVIWAHELLIGIAGSYGYAANCCGQLEELQGSFQQAECFGVADLDDSEWFKANVYGEFKTRAAGEDQTYLSYLGA